MKLLSTNAIIIWGTGFEGSNIITSYGLDADKFYLNRLFPDAREVSFSFFSVGINYYSFQYIDNLKCYSTHRTIFDRGGVRQGAYACSILIPNNKTVEYTKLKVLLDNLAQRFWDKCIGESVRESRGIIEKVAKIVANPVENDYIEFIKKADEILIEDNKPFDITKLGSKIGTLAYDENKHPVFQFVNDIDFRFYKRVYFISTSKTFSCAGADSIILKEEESEILFRFVSLIQDGENGNKLEGVNLLIDNKIIDTTSKNGRFDIDNILFSDNMALVLQKENYVEYPIVIRKENNQLNAEHQGEPKIFKIGERIEIQMGIIKLVPTINSQKEIIAPNKTVETTEKTNPLKNDDQKTTLKIEAISENIPFLQNVDLKIIFKSNKSEKVYKIDLSAVELQNLDSNETIEITATKDGYKELCKKEIKVSDYINKTLILKLTENAEKPKYKLTINVVEKINEKGEKKTVPVHGYSCKVFFVDKSKNKDYQEQKSPFVLDLDINDTIQIEITKEGYKPCRTDVIEAKSYFKKNKTEETIGITLKRKTNWLKAIKPKWLFIGFAAVAVLVILYFLLFNAKNYSEYYASERQQLDGVKNIICADSSQFTKVWYDENIDSMESKKSLYERMANKDKKFILDSINIDKYIDDCEECYKNYLTKLNNDISGLLAGTDFDLEKTNEYITKAEEHGIDTKPLELFHKICSVVKEANNVFAGHNEDKESRGEIVRDLAYITNSNKSRSYQQQYGTVNYEIMELNEKQKKALGFYRDIMISMWFSNFTKTKQVIDDSNSNFGQNNLRAEELQVFLNNRLNK